MHSFGYWLRRRRKALDLTQDALAERVSCSGFTIRKIEADERRPSRHLAERLVVALAIPADERRAFLDAARAVRVAERMPLDEAPVDAATQVAAPDSSADSPADPAAEATADSARDSTPFVGRSVEHGLLIGLVARLTAGTGHTVLIEGEPGIGKSRLMREVARYARSRGLSTLATNCYQIERAIPYQPVIDLVTRVFDHAPAGRTAPLGAVVTGRTGRLGASRGGRLSRVCRACPTTFRRRARHACFARVDQLLEAARQGRPLILTVDDVQWADDASAQVLHYLARQAAERPVLMIFAYRDEELGDHEPLARWVASLLREAHTRRVPLARLAPADCASLVATLGGANLGAPGLALRLHRETEGNPFFLMSMPGFPARRRIALGRTGERRPVAAARTPCVPRVRARLAYVPQEARATLEMAAVFGRRFDFDTLLGATREPELQLLDAVEIAREAPPVARGKRWRLYDFSHDKLREVVYRDIGGARRRLLHRAVALSAGTPQRQRRPRTRCRAWPSTTSAPRIWPKALEYLALAGERSQALFAMRDALHWFDRAVALCEGHAEALDESARLALYERRGAARAQAGQTEGAVADIRRVIAAARARDERDKVRDALIQLGMAYRRADAYEDATACLTDALAESRAMNDERHAADTLYHLGTVAWSNGRNVQAIGHHQEAVEICERGALTDLVAVQAYHGRGEAHFANAEPAAAIRCYSRSLELARGIGDKSYESENLMMVGHACTGAKGLGDYARAQANFEAALEIARAADLQWHLGPDTARPGPCARLHRPIRASLGRHAKNVALARRASSMCATSSSPTTFWAICCSTSTCTSRPCRHMQRGLALGSDTGIMFWRESIEANLAIARARLGQRGLAPALEQAREQSLRRCESLHDDALPRRACRGGARRGRCAPLPRGRQRAAGARARRTACVNSKRMRGAGAAKRCSPKGRPHWRTPSCRAPPPSRKTSGACA